MGVRGTYRSRSNRCARTAVLGAALVAALGAGGAAQTATASARCPAAVAGAKDLGTLAFVRDRKLVALDVATCTSRTLAPVGDLRGPVSWSADGRFVAFGASTVAARGGGLERPLPGSAGTLVWAPRGHELAGVTTGGGLLVGGPGMKPRRLLSDGWGATTVAWSPNGDVLAVSRSLYLKVPPPYHQEIWLLDLRSGGKRELFHLAKPELAPPLLQGFSPDGRWLLSYEDSQNSASLMADGLPLVAIRIADGKTARVGSGTLVYPDFVSWCGDALAYVVNRGGREVTLGDRIAMAWAPAWKPVVTPGKIHDTSSYVSPSCSSPNDFEMTAAVGPKTPDTPFGHERRRIWELGYTGGNWHPLGPVPPAGQSDELPMWSADGRWIAFVRSGPTNRNAEAPGALYLLDLRKGGKLVGPIAGVGSTGNYYGHYGWSAQLAWRPS